MIIAVHGFDWGIYAERVMPAFAHWLIDKDEKPIFQLYKETRCAREELYMPRQMQALRTWPRAQELIQQLPRGPFARREYQKLCAAEPFTALSDRYVNLHPPQLFQTSDALRTVWSALIEEYCLPWLQMDDENEPQEPQQEQASASNEVMATQSELISLLHSAGMDELAQEVSQQANVFEEVGEPAEDEEDEEDGGAEVSEVKGVVLGRQLERLHLRGWLASISVRAMALFELLACGRRALPFGYEPGEPFGSFIGYLTPNEVWQLALCLREAPIPGPGAAKQDYEQYRSLRVRKSAEFRMIDEVQPAHAQGFVKAVRVAAAQGLGLLCAVG